MNRRLRPTLPPGLPLQRRYDGTEREVAKEIIHRQIGGLSEHNVDTYLDFYGVPALVRHDDGDYSPSSYFIPRAAEALDAR